MADYASEAGHLYDLATGDPRYRIIGANGIERDTNLGDLKRAAKRGETWVPGATTLISQVESYGLKEYKRRQMFMAALTLTRQDGESDDDFYKRAKKDAEEHAKKSAKGGTAVHAAVESHYAGRPYDERLRPWVEAIENLLTQTFGMQEWVSEKSFASSLGYGGKVDLHSCHVLLDFKGREDASKFQIYDDNAEQLAAYAVGLGMEPWPICGDVFFDRIGITVNDDDTLTVDPNAKPAVEFHEVKTPELERGWRMFEPLIHHWKARNL